MRIDRRTIAGAVGFVLAVAILWVAVARLLASDRGIDLTDESLYLLDADPPSPYAAFGFPYGWITGPLFRAVGYDIARFRTLGGVILVLATALLAHQVLRASAVITGHGSKPYRFSAAYALLVGLLGSCGLLYYVGLPLLRTPSYNWLNLVGILLALSGVFLAIRSKRSAFPAAALIATGAFLTLHGKPSTPFLLAAAALPLLVRVRGARATAALLGWTLGIGATLVAVAWVTPLWPSDPVAPFLRGLRIPTVSPGHDPLNAVRLLLLSPVELARRALLQQPHWLVGPLLATAIHPLLLRPLLRHAQSTWAGRVGAIGAAALGAFLVLTPDTVVGWIHAGGLGPLSDLLMPGRDLWPVDGYLEEWSAPVRIAGWIALSPAAAARSRRSTTGTFRVAAALLIALGLVSAGLLRPAGIVGAGLIVGFTQLGIAWWLLEQAAIRVAGSGGREAQSDRHARWAAVAVLVAGIAAYAFGHDTGPVNAMPVASAIGVVALALLVSTAPCSPLRFPISRVMVGGAAAMLAVTLVGIASSWEAPYRSAPIRVQTVATPFGPNGAVLRLEPALAQYLRDLTDGAEAGGWRAGQRLYGLHATWSTGITYALSAEAAPSLQQFLGRGPDGLERFIFNLDGDDLTGWEDAWLLLPDFALRPEDGIDADELETVMEAVQRFGERVGTRWPEDYELVWTAPEDAPLAPPTRITLWRPREG